MTDSINISSITLAIEEMLKNNQDLEHVMISRAEPINDDPANCPWIGIYRREHRYKPRTLGAGAGQRMFEGDIVIAIQETSLADGAACEDLLDALVKVVIDLILTDPTITSLVEMTNTLTLTYSYDSLFPTTNDEDNLYEHYFQTAYLQMTMEARTG